MQASLDHLKASAVWVPVRIVPKAGGKKTDKIPSNADGYQVDAQNPDNCMSWWEADAARHALRLRPGESTGVGFVIRPEHGVWCVDLDDCIGDATLSDLALGFIEALPGVLMERSHSQTGLHLWGTGALPAGHRTRSATLPGLEVYSSGRFILMTEDWCGGWLDDHGPALSVMVDAMLGRTPVAAPFEWTDTGSNDALSDADIIARVCAHRIGGDGDRRGAPLWQGDADALGDWYPSSKGEAYDGSAADLALATLLMQHTGNNAERTSRLLAESGLARDKHSREDYVRWTVELAYRPDLRVTVDPVTLPWAGKRVDVPTLPEPPPAAAAPVRVVPSVPVDVVSTPNGPNHYCEPPTPIAYSIPKWAPDSFLGAADLAQHFAGCVYVSDRLAIYAPNGRFYDERQFNLDFGGSGVMFVMTADNKVTKKAWEAFHGSTQFVPVKVGSSCFNPDKPPGAIADDAVNTWVPPVVRMIPGDAEPYLSLLRKQLPDERDRRILLSWMAACVQHSTKKFRWSPYLQGLPGNGKTTHMSVIDYCIGAQYSCRPRSDMLGKQFNSMLDRKLFAGVDDVHVTMKMWAVLKPMITETVGEVERKGVDSSTVRGSVVKYLLTGNDQDGLPITRDNRRIAPFFTAHQELEDLERDGITEESLGEMYDWLNKEDGYAIVAHYLMNYPIDPEFNPAGKCQRAPFTSSTEAAIRACRSGIARHVADAVDITGELAADGTVTHQQMQFFYRKHNERMPDVAQCTKLLREFGFEWDRKVTWSRAQPQGGTDAAVPLAPTS